MLIGQKLATVVSSNSSKTLFRYLGKTTSYKDAYNYINRYSYFLQNEIQHGKKVMVYMSNCPHLAYTFFALANTKNIAIPVDPSTPDPKIVDKIKDMEIHAVIVSDDYVTRVKDLLKNNGIMIPVIQCEARRWGEYDTTYRLPVSMSASDTDVVALFDTAGTTGAPKTVPMNHTMLQQACLVLRSAYRAAAIDNFFSFNHSLSDPFYFIHGLLFPLMTGCGVVITDLVVPEELAKEMLEGKVTRVLMKAPNIEEWLNGFKNLNLKIPTLRSITPEYGPLEKRVEEFSIKEFNTKIINIYGSLETCWAVAARQFEEPEPFETVGQFLPGVKTRIIDDNGDDVPTNKVQRGQLIVSGNGVASSYYDNKEATKLRMRGAWFFTEDFVEVDKAGVVTFLDRKDNICRVVTNIVIPKHVEKKIMECPGVIRVAILGLKDAVGKTQLAAIISKKTGFDLSAADVTQFCKDHLAEHEVPRSIAFMDELPLDSHGEIDKYKLRFEFNS